MIEQPSICKEPPVLILDSFLGIRCMETISGEPRFEICERSKTRQHWRIWKTGNDDKYIRICQRRVDNEGNTSLATHHLKIFEYVKSTWTIKWKGCLYHTS